MTRQTTRITWKTAHGAAVLLHLLFAGSAAPVRAQAHDHGAADAADSTEVVQVVERFTEALATGDSMAVSAMLLPDALILERGGVESRHHYLGHHYPSDARFLQAMTREPILRKPYVVGDVAYVVSTTRLHGAYRDRSVDLNSSELMVLRKTTEGWAISAIHWSSRSNR